MLKRMEIQYVGSYPESMRYQETDVSLKASQSFDEPSVFWIKEATEPQMVDFI